MATSAPRSKQHIIQDIEAITHQPDFLYTLAFLCYRDFFVDPEEAGKKTGTRASLIRRLDS